MTANGPQQTSPAVIVAAAVRIFVVYFRVLVASSDA
jgi:hypothetical protein